MENKLLKFIQENSPVGGFLQSEYWRKFQEKWGRKTHAINISDEDGELVASANIIIHKLPVVGSYFYIPRGPIIEKSQISNFFDDLLKLGRENNIGWIRIEPNSDQDMKLIQENLPKGAKMKKAPVDMQPREILSLDISENEKDILEKTKQKTRYNIRLAEKKGVKIFVSREQRHVDEFCRLVKITAKRDGITSHPENYYRKMFEAIPPEILKLYVAEYEGKIIAANLILVFGSMATYMHGASDNEYRNVMAPYLLQWQQILDAKKAGCEKYDFGGVKTGNAGGKSWEGITKFKTGFAPEADPIKFTGSWDIIINSNKYNLYRILQKLKKIL
jgi:peptidoglycan pentaglycine glycine transferase (the first glycine)